MLDQMRRATKSGFSYILVGLLIVVFAVFFGVPTDGCRPSGSRAHLATVGGEEIFTEDVNVIYNRYYGANRSTTLDDTFYEQQATALKAVLATYVLANRAEEAGLRVSDEEFAAYITDGSRNVEFLSSYGRTGEFDGPFYERYVKFGLSVPLQRYENFKRRELLARKYMAMLDMQVSASPAEIDELNELRNTRVNLELVKFNEETMAQALDLSDQAIAAFIAANGDRIATYFKENRADYETDERVRIRRIYITKPSDETEDADALARFEDAKKRVVDSGEDFATVATELSEDYAKSQGGLMDWTTPENLDSAIAKAIEGVNVGEVREVETDFARMLIKVEEREEAGVPEITEVQDEIAQTLLREDLVGERGAQMAQKLHARAQADQSSLEEALTAIREEVALQEDAAEEATLWQSLNVEKTGEFTMEGQQIPAMFRAQLAGMNFGRSWDEIPRLGKNSELMIEVFNLTEAAPLLPRVAKIDNTLAVIRLSERKDAGELTAEERTELEGEIRAEKVAEFLGPWRFLFVNPLEAPGHFVDSALTEALEDGTIKLHEKNSPAAEKVKSMITGDDPLADLVGMTE
ncbi:hypothetical protein DL240_04895 [Lujinxingia litoralis]|uniref:Periplasmic chaperone PpiD n=1 Tax=Lujinxingia litoralis TaxID=2211119 RepID=A0A328C7H3_9DELT|nr:SurA N-terminal domain-containing protein [Lujinxingia litoralis]RAL23500.1 hypothetical protein DL240_04895 [Lujinxingia litoralis]